MLTHLIYSNNYDFWFRDIYKFGNIYVFVTDTVSYCVFVGQQHWILYHMHISLKKLKNVETIFKVIHIRGRQKNCGKMKLDASQKMEKIFTNHKTLKTCQRWNLGIFKKRIARKEKRKERKDLIDNNKTKQMLHI